MRFLNNVTLILFLSFLVGMLVDAILRRTANYAWLSSRYLFAKSTSYERLGVLWFRWFLLITPLRYFNTQICFTEKRDLKTLRVIRDNMACTEVSHWSGAVAMLGVTCIVWWHRGLATGLWFLLVNLVGNVYPSLLQQYNKRRLERVIAVVEKRTRPRN